MYKGILIGIYDNLFENKDFGIIFSHNFTQTKITQNIGNGNLIQDDNTGDSHSVIVW